MTFDMLNALIRYHRSMAADRRHESRTGPACRDRGVRTLAADAAALHERWAAGLEELRDAFANSFHIQPVTKK
jgi:hypothetical protein